MSNEHIVNDECRKNFGEMRSVLEKLQYVLLGNGQKEESVVFRLNKIENEKLVREENLDDYVSRNELTIRENELLKNLATKEDMNKLIDAIDKKFVRKSETKRSVFTLLKAFGVAILTVGGSIIVAIIMKGA